MAATNIITGTVADYTDTTANTLIATSKVDKVARADTEVATHGTGDWANKVDDDLTAVNAVMRGGAGAFVWVSHVLEAQWTGDSNIRYMPFVGGTESTATSGAWVSMPLAYDGEVVRMVLIQNTGTPMGSTDLTTHIGSAGAHPGAAAETENIANVASLDTSYTENFASTTFSAGDRLSIGVNPANDPAGGITILTVVIKYDTNT